MTGPDRPSRTPPPGARPPSSDGDERAILRLEQLVAALIGGMPDTPVARRTKADLAAGVEAARRLLAARARGPTTAERLPPTRPTEVERVRAAAGRERRGTCAGVLRMTLDRPREVWDYVALLEDLAGRTADAD